MREIKFRAYYGNHMYEVTGIGKLNSGSSIVLLDKQEDSVSLADCKLMQYTGLKDKNGKEIYESDLIKIEYGGEEMVLEVKWSRCGEWYLDFRLGGIDFDGVWYWSENSPTFEVIGNIHQNPELLKNNG